MMHAAGRRRHALPAVQPGRRRRRRQPAQPGRPPHRLSVGGGLGSGIAGWKSSAATWCPGRTTRSSSSRLDLPALPPVRRDAETGGAVLADGPGGKYLIQHSAGSGKTNSIAWTAHFLADLHDAEDRQALRYRDGGLRPHGDRQRSCRRPSSGSSAPRAWWR